MVPNKLINFCSELEIDNGIPKAKFFAVHTFADSVADENKKRVFLDAQEKLIGDFSNQMSRYYGDRVFVSDNLWCSEFMKVEIGKKDVSNALMVTILQFLKNHNSCYCVNIVVYEDLHVKRSPYIGRILVSGRGITVEESLRGLFQKMIDAKTTGNQPPASAPVQNKLSEPL